MISCLETLRRFYDYLDRELPEAQAHEVEEHLEDCKKCLTRMEFEKLYKKFVADAGRETVSTDELKARILANIRQLEQVDESGEEALFPNHTDHAPVDDVPLPAPFGSPAGGRRRVPMWSYVFVAAAVLLAALPFILPDKIGSVPTGLAPLAAIHMAGSPDFRHSDPGELSDWLSRHHSLQPAVGGFAEAGCAVKGASVDSIWSILHLESKGVQVSIFVAAAEQFPVPGDMQEVRLGDYTVWTAEGSGLAFVVWEYHPDGVVCAAVASGPMQQVLDLVRRVEDLMRQA